MPVSPLPDHPNAESLRKQAKTLLRYIRAGVPEALAMLAEFHPRRPTSAALSDAQLVTARRYGFASWGRLMKHLETVGRYTRSPHEAPVSADPAAELLRLACLTYGDDYPDRLREAAALLAADPSLAMADVYTMAATGAAAGLRAALAADPSLARAQGGPFGWEPLLYLAYARFNHLDQYVEADLPRHPDRSAHAQRLGPSAPTTDADLGGRIRRLPGETVLPEGPAPGAAHAQLPNPDGEATPAHPPALHGETPHTQPPALHGEAIQDQPSGRHSEAARSARLGRYGEAAHVLLDHGADPDAGFLWDGLPSPFTALTGAFGGGEGDQPPHPDGLALARILLAAGADANDPQTLYNRGLGGSWSDDTTHLELLLEYGLGRGDGGPWRARLGPALPAPADLLTEELATAALRGGPRRVRLLLSYGVPVDRPGAHPVFGGRTPYELALVNGHREVAELLAAAGARAELDPMAAFTAACMSADAEAVAALGPETLARALTETPDLINRAAEHRRPDVIRLLAGLGFDVDHRDRCTPLHAAAWNDDVDTVATLLALGADPSVTDADHDSTPLGWAEYGDKQQVAAYLRTSYPGLM
ncbi:ankyrin repeat domain-containing protein [Nonomuraea typhae]|uniref:Ankyrin repeat domain-containing protein n=1 Tax=Nonomuraea typhae TaxID=2603600 RepID=A0ABW7YJL1_9ACTN